MKTTSIKRLAAFVFAAAAISGIIVISNLIFASERNFDEILIKSQKYVFCWGCFLLGVTFFFAKKYVSTFFSLAAGFIALCYWTWLMSWLYTIGSDSLSEGQNFSVQEAIFFVKTLLQVATPDFSILRWGAALISAGCVIGGIYFIQFLFNIKTSTARKINYVAGALLIISPLAFNLMHLKNVFVASEDIATNVERNFSASPEPAIFSNDDLDLIVYIGESTSILNMNIYGYPRATTPNLSELQKTDHQLLVFNNVLSTHTHTFNSLLEALSVSNDDSDAIEPIENLNRSSIVDILVNSGKKTYLISNQGQNGMSDLVNKIIFKNSEKNFSVEINKQRSRATENLVSALHRPYDHEFILPMLELKLNEASKTKGNIYFLHTYAGHGNYHENIPESYRTVVDSYYSNINPNAVAGDKFDNLGHVEEYDAAIRYIDHALSQVIGRVATQAKPTVLIYFSDHGESIFTKRGHDSARFTHEMARVPFLIYFNSAAVNQYPDLFEKYKTLSNSNAISTLAQLPITVFDLLGGDIIKPNTLKPIGEKNTILRPILVRNTNQGTTFVELTNNQKTNYTSEAAVNNTDNISKIFVASRSSERQDFDICYHRANTIASAVRGAHVSNCLEFDVVVEGGKISVRHPPSKNVNLGMHKILEIAERNNLSIWIDAKNIDVPENCNLLTNELEKRVKTKNRLLIEFPPNTNPDDKNLAACARKLQNMGYATSYYVPSGEAEKCAKALTSSSSEKSQTCAILDNKLRAIVESKLFSDFSFSYHGIVAMQHFEFTSALNWNAWHIDADKITSLPSSRFKMLIPTNNDPNRR